MLEGDDALIYHTGDEKSLIGLARIASAALSRSRLEDSKLVVVDIEAGKPLARQVTLAEIKADPAFAELGLVRQGRLSVVPVEPDAMEAAAGDGGRSSGSSWQSTRKSDPQYGRAAAAWRLGRFPSSTRRSARVTRATAQERTGSGGKGNGLRRTIARSSRSLGRSSARCARIRPASRVVPSPCPV